MKRLAGISPLHYRLSALSPRSLPGSLPGLPSVLLAGPVQRVRAMDISNIRDQVSNLTLYDLKAGVRKVQNGMSSSPLSLGRRQRGCLFLWHMLFPSMAFVIVYWASELYLRIIMLIYRFV